MHSQAKSSNDLSTIVSSAQEKINAADTQSALHNDIGARNMLTEAQKMLEDIKDKPKSPVEVVILLEKIQEKLDRVNKVTRVDSPKELSNFSSLVSNIDAKNLVYLNGALYAINTKGAELVATIADKGDKQILTKIASDAGEIQALATYDNDRILVLETSKSRVFEFSLKTNKLEEKTNAQGIAYPDANAINTYLSTLYFLDKNNGTFTKYAHSGAGYDKGRDVFKAGAFNLKDINSFAIDGNIYLLFDNGTIEKTLKGSIDTNFKLKNIPEPDPSLNSPNQIITNTDSTSLYVLENKKHRILELNKNGDYLRQFAFKDSIGDINSLAVNEKAKKLYLLAKNSIFEIDL
jgi:DNA-binding beta-propeller fold protein YncE